MRTLILILLASSIAFGSEFYMLNFQLNSLFEKNRIVDLNKYKGKILFLTFIKSDCEWCSKELKVFSSLKKSEHAKEINVVVITLGDDTYALKVKTKEVKYPVLRASEELLDTIGGIEMTPYTLIADKKGNFETKIVGYQTAEQIESIIHKLKEK